MSRADLGDLWVVYDGECPFCSSYARLYRIRSHAANLHLIDARDERHPLVAEIKAHGLDLNQGMAVKFGGQIYHGAAAMEMLAVLGAEGSLFNRLNRTLFRHPWLARRLYPLLVCGRLLTLKLLGRSLIGAS